MILPSILGALALEHFHRLQDPSPPGRLFDRYVSWLRDHFNAGMARHGMLAWLLGVLLSAVVVAAIGGVLEHLLGLLGWAWSVVVLYYCMGFKQYSFALASVARALRAGDLDRARSTLAEWRPGNADALSANELSRAAIEHLLRLAMTRLFGVLFWFALLGVFGAVMYRLSGLCRQCWHGEAAFCEFPERLVSFLDWVPARATAFSFAIVGNFEAAMECWRSQAALWGEPNEGVLLAAGSGALGVRLGGPLTLPAGELLRPELGTGESASPDFMEGSVSLVWRAVMLWLGVGALVWLGSL